jgi:hypothetical protein
MAHVMKEDVPFDPCDIRFLCSYRILFCANHVAYVIKKLPGTLYIAPLATWTTVKTYSWPTLTRSIP